jgi:hypothetical protein
MSNEAMLLACMNVRVAAGRYGFVARIVNVGVWWYCDCENTLAHA